VLTDKEIRALESKQSRYITTDGRGLSIEVLPSGIKTWIFRYRTSSGRQERLTMARYPDLTLAGARKERDRLAQLVAAGKSPAAQKRLSRSGGEPTVRAFADRYYQEQVVPNRKDPSEMRRYLDVDIVPALGKMLLKDVGVLDCQRLIYKKRDKGRISVALHLRAVLKQLFDYALELQLVTLNPAAMVATKYIGKTRKRTRALSPSELRSLMPVLPLASD
jgi:hypothetical protein